MVTWFEDGAWRMRGAALSDASQADENAKRLTDLLGSEEWKSVQILLKLQKYLSIGF